MPNDWKEAHDKAKEYIADLEKANVKLRDQAIKYIDRLETRDFYELCQQYRHQKIDAATEFELIKEYIRTGKLPWPSYEE